MWRLPCFRRNILPEPVTLKRLATAFRVLAFPAARAMGRGGYPPTVGFQGILRFFADLKEIAPPSGSKVLSGKCPEESLSPPWLEDFASNLAVFVDLKIMKGPFGPASRRVLQIGLQLGREHFEDRG